MPRTELVVRVFVAAPDDVRDEVTALFEVVEELNRIHSLHSGVRLEPVNWRTDAVPGLGTDPQAVIYDQIGGEYDIFVGILWAKFGMPTPRAGSGTEEEFENARRRYQSDPKSVRVMLYFKNAPIALDDIDPTQLASVRGFRSRVGNEALYSTFADHDDFVSLLRLHLTRHIQFWAESHLRAGVPVGTSAAVAVPVTEVEDEGEEGFLDLLEAGTKSLGAATQAIERIGELQAENSARTQLSTKQLEAVAQAPPDQKNRLVKQVFDIVASDLNNLAKGLNDQSAAFAAAFAASMEATSKALAYQEFWPNVKPAERATYMDAITQIEANAAVMEGALAELNETIAGLPRVTTVFNRAKKNAVAAIDGVRTALARSTRLVADLRKGGFFNV
jgi:hypothetical protein